jgi:hypothetical protein
MQAAGKEDGAHDDTRNETAGPARVRALQEVHHAAHC